MVYGGVMESEKTNNQFSKGKHEIHVGGFHKQQPQQMAYKRSTI
jgi:hypothetical protein